MVRIVIMYVMTFVFCMFCIVQGKEIQLVAKDMPLKTLVQTIARTEGLSVVGLEGLEGNVSLQVKEKNGTVAIQKLGQRLGFLVYDDQGTLVVEGMKQDQRRVRRVVADTSTPEELQQLIQTIVPKEHIRHDPYE